MPDTTSGPAPVLTGLRVLVVENNEDTLEMFAVYLRHCGASVATAQTSREALDYLTGQCIDAIVTDVSVIKGLSAAAFVRQVREQHGTTPVIAVTGWAEKDGVCKGAEFTAFMQKPVDLDALVATIRNVTGIR